jgi:streptomycin 6-kinase
MRADDSHITIPAYFGTSIHRFFGDEGDTWFAQLHELLLKCICRWDLRDCQIAANLSVNLICYAVSPEFGPVVLKIGFPHPEFYSELAALSLYRGRNVCALYDTDLELGAMLIARVLPGYNLKALDDEGERLNIALDVIANLPMPAEPHPAIPAFSDWIERAFTRARRERKVKPEFLYYLDQTEKLFYEVTAQEPAHMLLHGDLHHENMLYSEDGEWVVIDPKGVTGIRSLEAGRYILNAIWFTRDAQKPRVLEALVNAFAGAFHRPRRTIAICAMVDCVLSRTWTFEEHLTPEVFAREEADALRMFPMYLDCVNRMPGR